MRSTCGCLKERIWIRTVTSSENCSIGLLNFPWMVDHLIFCRDLQWRGILRVHTRSWWHLSIQDVASPCHLSTTPRLLLVQLVLVAARTKTNASSKLIWYLKSVECRDASIFQWSTQSCIYKFELHYSLGDTNSHSSLYAGALRRYKASLHQQSTILY